MPAPTYDLYYWPSLQGRGELVRLALEQGGATYRDVARLPEAEGGGVPAILRLLRGEAAAAGTLAPFAPPILVHEGRVIAQTSVILGYLAPRLGLAPDDETLRTKLAQLQLTIADVYGEAHDTHHPVSTAAYYEDQKPEALARSKAFREARLPKLLGYFERAVPAEGWIAGNAVSYVDLSLFQLVAGLRYAFPKAFARVSASTPKLLALSARVEKLPRIAGYLESPRRIAHNEDDIFRRYPELDDP